MWMCTGGGLSGSTMLPGSSCWNRAREPGAAKKNKLQRLLVLSKTSLSNKPPAPSRAPACQPIPQAQGYRSKYGYFSQSSKLGDKACLANNQCTCTNNASHNASHPQDLHVCAFCFHLAFKLCKHPEAQCKRKAENAKNGAGGSQAGRPSMKITTWITRIDW